MAPDHLHKRDPDRNMARFYRVDVQPTLFGEASVARSWGRIGTAGRTAFEPARRMRRPKPLPRRRSARS
jgi:predicted DNA-binding WGR domain protein